MMDFITGFWVGFFSGSACVAFPILLVIFFIGIGYIEVSYER